MLDPNHIEIVEPDINLNDYRTELYTIEIFSIGMFFICEFTTIYYLVRNVIHPELYPETIAIPFTDIVKHLNQQASTSQNPLKPYTSGP